MLDDLYAKSTKGNRYLDDIMVSDNHARRPKGIDTSHLSKIWRIDLDSAKWTLDITSQHVTRRNNPTISRNYGENNRMMRYKIIKEHFFMNIFFSTKTAGKYSWGDMCWQLFVIDKSFVYVVPMKSN